MKNKKVLVTGGAGFIGSHLVDVLINNNNTVIIIDSLISSTEEYIEHHIDSGKCEFIKEDIREEKFLSLLSLSESFDFIFHLAADPSVKDSVLNPMESFNHNVKGTLNLLELIRQQKTKGKKIQGFIFASSGGTLYGDVEKFPIEESVLLNPISPYGASKASCEMYISAYASAYEFKAASCRYANIQGERSTHGVVYDIYNKLNANSDELTILGDGMQQKSYLHVSDCVNATLLLADYLPKQKKWYDYYNIGSGEWITVKDIVKIIKKEMNLTGVRYKFTGGQKGWVGDVHKMILSIEKIEKTTGWTPKLSLNESICQYIKWLQKKN